MHTAGHHCFHLLGGNPTLLVAVVGDTLVLFPIACIPVAGIVTAFSFLDTDQGTGTGQH